MILILAALSADRCYQRRFADRASLRYGLKQIGSLRLLFGRMLAHAPFFMARSLIQSAS